MFFSRLALILASLIFLLSLFQLGLGLFILFGTTDMAANATASRAFGSENSGEFLDRAAHGLLASDALGTFAEISKHLNALKVLKSDSI